MSTASSAAAQMTEQARTLLQQAAAPANVAKMQAYLKTDQPFYGVKKPALATIAKQLYRIPVPDTATYRAVIEALWSGPHREEQYLAIDVARRHKRFVLPAQLDLYARMVQSGAWWDLVDPIAAHLVGRVWQQHRAATEPVVDRWIDSEDMWLRRTAIIGQLRHKSELDQARLFRFCLARAHESEFFIRKAIGWALRDHARVAPESVQAFLNAHWQVLSGLSRREAARNMVKAGWTPPWSTSSAGQAG